MPAVPSGASRRRRRWLPRTGRNVRWPARAHRAGQVAVFGTVFLLVFGFLLVRISPPTFLRLVAVYGSLPAAVIEAALFSGVIFFALDSLRLVLTELRPPSDQWRRRLLLGTAGLWLLLTIVMVVTVLWYPAWVLFGGTP
ncbi:MAG: hypothetical protein ACR2P2_19935 [Nakamurella sp.]